jgi:hypothetical protein
MSANRSVQAAQRRRAGPPDTGSRPQFSPQPSINSAQLFANQARSGPGPNIPSGRLAGQHAALQQQQQMQQQMNAKDSKDKLSSVNKMTINQAITLITLRLGAIETKLMNSDRPETNAEFMNTIRDRLSDLENRTVISGSSTAAATSVEFALLKQQVEAMSKQNKGIKEVSNLKSQIEELRNELTQTKELINVLQNVVLENSQKILDLSLSYDDQEQEQEQDQNEIIGNDLKEIIENELNIDAN